MLGVRAAAKKEVYSVDRASVTDGALAATGDKGGSMISRRKLLLLSNSVLLAPVCAMAQTNAPVTTRAGGAPPMVVSSPAARPQGDQTAPAASTVQEVVVTAEKRESTLQRTPAALEVVGADTLQRQRIVEITDLNTVLNNTQIVPVGVAQQVIIRGIGNNFVDPRADPAVATSINGLFYDRPLPLGFGILDVSRVEDLEGPQGTLYGRNSAAGALNIVTNQPTRQFGGSVQGSVGNLGENDFTGVLNVPVNDKFALRFAYDRDRRDGYISGFYDDVHSDTARISARWTPTDKLTLYFESDYVFLGGHGDTPEAYPCAGARAWVAFVPKTCSAIPPGGATPTSGPLVGREATFVASDQLHLDYDFGWATLTSITGYVDTHQRGAFPNGSYFTNTDDSDSHDYSEELRLAGHDSASHKGGFAWQVGTYLFDSTGDYYFHTQRPTTNAPPTGTLTYTKIPQSSEAGYVQATYGLTDSLRVTGGVRYTSDSKGINFVTTAYLPPRFTVVSPATTGAARASSDKVTYKGGLEYDVAPGKLLYATISTGYAAAGVNGGSPNVPLTPKEAPAVFRPETITAYELGSKNRFFDNRLQLNAAAYYYDFKDYQYLFPSYVQGGGSKTNIQIQNAGSVTAYGLEIGAEFAATHDDRFSASIALTHATFGALNYAGYIPPVTATEVSVASGSELVNDPKWSALLGYEHTWRMADGSTWTLGVNSKLSGKYLLIVASTVPADYQREYIKTDLNIAYHWAANKYVIRGWVKNVENVPVNVYGEGASFNLYGVAPPRTYGVTATANF